MKTTLQQVNLNSILQCINSYKLLTYLLVVGGQDWGGQDLNGHREAHILRRLSLRALVAGLEAHREDESYEVTVHLLVASLSLQIWKVDKRIRILRCTYKTDHISALMTEIQPTNIRRPHEKNQHYLTEFPNQQTHHLLLLRGEGVVETHEVGIHCQADL
ncbi:hypothetical protein E2C01_005338 [Portunus trituberculatus]|uniref:Uncharacterized protein n=1 Tax=Portunus trituberculatus TaxID=210409 RepID=A0A5B7CVA0_PORTR|nr:hypothetical protein [Portunus trituberculatus]